MKVKVYTVPLAGKNLLRCRSRERNRFDPWVRKIPRRRNKTHYFKKLPANTGDVRDVRLSPGLGRSLGGGHSNPLPCSCLENPTDREAWQATVHGVPKSRTRLKQLSTHEHTITLTRYFYSVSNSCCCFFFFFLVEMFKSYLILKVREMVLVGNSVCTGSGALGSMTRGPEQHPQAVPRAVRDPNPASSSA